MSATDMRNTINKLNSITEKNYTQMTTSEKISKARDLLEKLKKYTYVRRDTKGIVKQREGIQKAIDEIYNNLINTSGLDPQEIKRQIFSKDLQNTNDNKTEEKSFKDMSPNEQNDFKEKITKARNIFNKIQKLDNDGRKTKAIVKQRERLTQALDNMYNELIETGINQELILGFIDGTGWKK